MKYILYLVVSLTLIACNKGNTVKAEAEIKQKLDSLYSWYNNNDNTILYEEPLPKNLFSADLEETINQAVSESKINIANTKNGDKPLLMEGSKFSSLYEGYSSYKVKTINIIKIQDGETAEVFIEMEYDKSSPKIIWTDKVELFNIKNSGWRIDNITFDTILSTEMNLKMEFENFTKLAKEQNNKYKE